MTTAAFVSFHYKTDNSRVQQVLKIGGLTGQTILDSNDWEEVKGGGKAAIEKWIAEQMAGKTHLLVLVGEKTATSEWVDYEIRHAWAKKMKILGVRIHGLKGFDQKTTAAGADPFKKIAMTGGGTMADHVTLHDPSGTDSKAKYADIEKNLATWMTNATKPR